MIINLIDKIGDWNPQLFREIKGRFKGFNIASTLIISLVGQVILFLCQLANLPGEKYSLAGEYCRLRPGYEYKIKQLSEQSNNLQRQLDSYLNTQPRLPNKIQELKAEIAQIQTKITDSNNYFYKNVCPTDQVDLQMWWREHWGYIFFSLSLIFIFTLLVAGTYLLINNLATEERRGTLNFLRLSPQSESSILIGKILGVPILIYLLVFTAVPLHFIAGYGANLATSHILGFWVVLTGCCIFFYSAALLFGLSCRCLNGFQAWFGSGAVLLFLVLTIQVAFYESESLHSSFAWFRLLSPFDMTRHLFPSLFHDEYKVQIMQKLQFFYIPVGRNVGSLIALHLLNDGLWTYWIWQALKRCFRNSNATIFSKEQSYLSVACCQFVFWGFALQYRQDYCHYACEQESTSTISCCMYDMNSQIQQSFMWLVFFNLVLLFSLIAILSPHRQTIQDWARFRHQNLSNHQSVWRKSLLLDLIFGEKSPSFVAIAINLVIVTVPLLVWILLAPVLNVHNTSNIDWQINHVGRLKTVLGIAMFITLMIIYATIAQRMLLMKTTKRSFWAVGTIGAAVFLPPIILGMLSVDSSKYPSVWLFSTFPWASLEYASTPTIFLAWLGELSVLVLLNLHLTKQIKLAGESATKALLSQ